MSEFFTNLYGATLLQLRDLEKQQTATLSQLAISVHSEKLRKLIASHHVETKEQLRRLKRIFSDFSKSRIPTQQMPSTARRFMGLPAMDAPSPALDSGLITSLQTAELNEISCYSSAFGLAKLLSRRSDAELLAQSLSEENRMNDQLYQMGETLNIEILNPRSISKPCVKKSAQPIFSEDLEFKVHKISLRSGDRINFYRAR